MFGSVNDDNLGLIIPDTTFDSRGIQSSCFGSQIVILEWICRLILWYQDVVVSRSIKQNKCKSSILKILLLFNSWLESHHYANRYSQKLSEGINLDSLGLLSECQNFSELILNSIVDVALKFTPVSLNILMIKRSEIGYHNNIEHFRRVKKFLQFFLSFNWGLPFHWF